MDWFLYDNGLRHERVKCNALWMILQFIGTHKLPFSFGIIYLVRTYAEFSKKLAILMILLAILTYLSISDGKNW